MLSHPYLSLYLLYWAIPEKKKKQGIEDYGISRCIKEIACGISSGYLKKSGISKGDQEKMAEKMAILHFRTPLGLGLR